MKYSTVALASLSAGIASATPQPQWSGNGWSAQNGSGWAEGANNFGKGNWNNFEFAPSCAQSCFSSAFPTETSTAWSQACEASATSALPACITSACSISSDNVQYSTISSIRASVCSAYSSCSSSSSSCDGWPFSANPFEQGGWGPVGPNGIWTVTQTGNIPFGTITRTVTATTTPAYATGSSASPLVITSVQTGIVIAAAATDGASSSAGAAGPFAVNAIGGILGAGLAAVMAL